MCKLWINLPALASVPLFCLEVPVVPNLHGATGLTVYQGNTKAMTICQGNTPKIQWVARSCLHVGVRWMGYAPSVLDLLHQLWEELLPWERTQWPWSKHVKFRPSWLFHKGCLSLRSCQTAILSHVGTLNSAYRGLSTCQSAFIGAIALLFLSSSFIWNPWASLGRILPHSGFATKTIHQGAPLPAEHSKN